MRFRKIDSKIRQDGFDGFLRCLLCMETQLFVQTTFR